MKNKIGIAMLLCAVMAMIFAPAAFADEGSGDSGSSSGSSAKAGGTPKKVCEGSRYSFDHTGVSLYKVRYNMKDSGKVEDPRYEGSVWRAIKNVAGFERTVKWQACE